MHELVLSYLSLVRPNISQLELIKTFFFILNLQNLKSYPIYIQFKFNQWIVFKIQKYRFEFEINSLK